MSRSLWVRALIGSVLGAALIIALIFWTAGSFNYWQGWAYLGVLAASSFLSTPLLRKDRGLLERRLKVAESSAAQKVIVSLAYLDMVALIALSALDHRFGWSSVAPAFVIIGDLIVAAGLYLYFLVFRENTFAGSTVEVVEGQRVISTGPYAIVRHPLYVALLVTLLGTPLAMGSWWGLVLLIPLIPLIVWRLLDEETYLVEKLPGYAEYRLGVRWRLVPGLF